MLVKQQKPKFLNLLQISMPVTAIVSVLHRLSGLLLVLILPVIIYGFYLSTQSKARFESLMNSFDSLFFQLVLIAVVWAISHHILAGIRFLLIDIDLGLSLSAATKSSWVVNLTAVIVTLLFAKGLLF
ncbi:MAG: succinate dehydrogenase, cytochrome b556 subunit [Thiohalomonadales bacterium]